MIAECPVCSCEDYASVWYSKSPSLPIVARSNATYDHLFSDIDIVVCDACGHVYNHVFAAEAVDSMYGDVALTNIPVDPTMDKRLEDLAAWLPKQAISGQNVIEVGAGGGHLARLISRDARRVLVVEPCRALTKDMLPESNIDLVHDLFPTATPIERANLIIARQVLEHIPEPSRFLQAIADALDDGGFAYIEVPHADYIERFGALLDLHAQHVHYFDVQTLVDLAGRAGLSVLRTHFIKDEHDFGVLFRRSQPQPAAKTPLETVRAKADRWKSRLSKQSDMLRSFDMGALGKIALYGATMHGTVFVNQMRREDSSGIDVVFDDNRGYQSLGLYTRDHFIQTAIPNTATINEPDAIIITAYLHDIAISKKLRDLNFTGRILTVRPQPYTPALGSTELIFNANLG